VGIGLDIADIGETLTILVVEDDAATADLIRTLLNAVPGWGAAVVHDAAAAAEVFKHIEIEILVLDVNLPGISGVELLAHLRRDRHWREPPVILMTAAPEQPVVRQALERGDAIRLLSKPFDVDELIAAVRQATTELRSHAREGASKSAG
jgi:DNA-binding response OmpR family regulator